MTPTTRETIRATIRLALLEARARLDARQQTLDERAHTLALAQRDRDAARREVAALEEVTHELWPTHDAKTPTTPTLPPTCDRADTKSLTSPPRATAYPTSL